MAMCQPLMILKMISKIPPKRKWDYMKTQIASAGARQSVLLQFFSLIATILSFDQIYAIVTGLMFHRQGATEHHPSDLEKCQSKHDSETSKSFSKVWIILSDG